MTERLFTLVLCHLLGDYVLQTEFACGYLPINVDENEAICENAHVQAIVKAYKACL